MAIDTGTKYDCIVIGGGIAGLQGAIQLGRYKHRTLIIDKGVGRSTLCRSYHNVLGWPDGVSGTELRRLGRQHAEQLGVQFMEDEVIRLLRSEDGFVAETKSGGDKLATATILLATGIMDRYPNLPGLERCFGLTVYVCPDCDGYEVSGKQTIVMGAGNVGASMALTLRYWTEQLTYINHEPGISRISTDVREQLADQDIMLIEQPITEVLASEAGEFQGARLQDGQMVKGERGFIAFGGNEVQSGLAAQLGLERLENRHIVTDPRSKMTNVPGVWAAGDVGVHAEQVTIAMGEGSQAAIWIHKELLKRGSKTLHSCGTT
ncbi:NAD(P)/FAD-dependent oxidoreductase [Paenibacillus sp. H1-7]|uniref:NAD(P)/FAD-dependent oxidoreductase n=1 Tax=Paenibacillus sp. H1-7 TaxID=2282849 RepID=UPI001EF7A068|nr:NAD(P)/FAD-dependent oxidoreductase [Paenibacillus sp. H1-7]ULL14237.1 NAD(P)/FAD-dependent oxidoreductase [Paenibacillus sp. H1-7]